MANVLPSYDSERDSVLQGIIGRFSLRRKNMWASSSVPIDLPEQGWKLHVSATNQNAIDVIEMCAQALTQENCCFKIPNNFWVVRWLLNAVEPHYAQVGKIVTIYPSTYQEFLRIVFLLHSILQGSNFVRNPYERYLPGLPVSYRYGQFSGGELGRISLPNGESTEDDRTKYKPDWITDPLLELFPNELNSEEPWRLGSELRDWTAITQRAKGGIYKASLKLSSTEVIVKEGRIFGDQNYYGVDARNRIEKEISFYKHPVLRSALPNIVDTQYGQTSTFMVTEKFLDIKYSLQAKEFVISRFPFFLEECIRLVGQFHQAGYYIRDIKSDHLLFDGNQVKLIDLEGAGHVSWEPVESWTTAPYSAPEALTRASLAQDVYALGVCFLQIFCNVPIKTLLQSGFNLQKLVDPNILPLPVYFLLHHMLQQDFKKRPTISDICSEFSL